MMRFTPVFACLLAAMIVWTVFFMGTYGLVAVICAIALPRTIIGLPPAHLALGTATLIALTITSFLAFSAWRQKQTGSGPDGSFTANLVILQSIIALIAIAWNFLPLAFLEDCGLQQPPRR